MRLGPSYTHIAIFFALGGVPVACSGDDGVGAESATTTESTATTATSGSMSTTTGAESTSTSTGESMSTSDATSEGETTTSTSTTTMGATTTEASTTEASTTEAGTTEASTTTTGVLPEDVPEPFNQYCIATFTEEYETDLQGLTVNAGESYLYYDDFIKDHRMIYFDENGPVGFEVSVPLDEELPFTSNCLPVGDADRYLAALGDTTIYKDESLQEIACEISEGTVGPHDGGYEWSWVVEVDGGDIYKYTSEDLQNICDATTSGYIFVPYISVLGGMAQSFSMGLIAGP